MILLIDNYDSFSYNLVQIAGGINPDIRVIRNDELTVAEIEALQPSHIILSVHVILSVYVILSAFVILGVYVILSAAKDLMPRFFTSVQNDLVFWVSILKD